MSVRMMSLVWELDLPDSEKLVLLALADCANDEGHCWPSVNTLKKKCSKSDRTVQLSIKMLCAKGHLTRREVLGKGCNYTVHPIVRFASTPEATNPRSADAPKPTTQTPEAASDKPSRTITSVSNETGGGPPDPVKGLFDVGVSVLTATGLTEKEARSLIGKWRKGNSDGEVLTALIDCRTRAISSPVEWMAKRLGGGKRYVSASGYEYRGDLDAIQREAKRRNDMDTYWQVEIDRKSMARAA